MDTRRALVLAVLAAPALIFGLVWSWKSSVVYLFFLAVAVLLIVATRVGGDWLSRTSRGRFDDQTRR